MFRWNPLKELKPTTIHQHNYQMVKTPSKNTPDIICALSKTPGKTPSKVKTQRPAACARSALGAALGEEGSLPCAYACAQVHTHPAFAE
jgi:hypothetical protein